MLLKKNRVLLTGLILMINACKPAAENNNYTNENGLLVEKVEQVLLGDDPYIVNNKIYNAGKTFVFTYYYLNPKGDTMLYRSVKPEREDFASIYKAWELVPRDSADAQTATQVSYRIIKGLAPFIDFDRDFNKTVVEIQNLNAESKEVDQKDVNSLVENPANVWLPQPRTKLFRILELNPFPLIQMPLKKGKTWQWSHDVDEWWNDPRWGTWGGKVHNVCDYMITSKETLSTPFGALECWVVTGNTASNLGKSAIKTYFHEQYGFVKMEYANVNKSKLVQTLEKITFN